jgi:hypothetical protein
MTMIDLGEFSPVPSEHYATVCHIVAGIARSCDLGTIEQYLSFMTQDAVFEFPAMPHLGVAAHVVRGHDEIRQGVVSRRSTGAAGPGSHTVHLISTTNAWTIDADTVRALSFFTYYGDTDKAPVLRTMGHYDNTFRKVDGVWLLSHRIISTL